MDSLKKARFVALFLASFAPAVFASSYQVELGGQYGYMDDSQSLVAGSAKMYFAPVDTQGVVLAEAAFLARASSLTVRYGAAELLYDGKNILTGNELVDFGYTEFAVDWFGATSGLYLGFSKESFTPDDDAETSGYDDYDTWSANFGFTPLNNILVYSTYDDQTGYDPNLSVKYVSSLNNGKAVNLEAKFIDYGDSSSVTGGSSEGRNFLSVGIDIYTSQQFSFGGTISQQDDTTFGVRTRYFLKPNVSVGAFAYSGDSAEQLGVTGRVRF